MSIEKGGWIKTTTHNLISRDSFIHEARNVEMKGRTVIMPGCHIRGDFATVRIGRYCNIKSGTIIRPPHAQASPGAPVRFLPLKIGSHTHIGKNCVVESAAIGSSVFIGDNCVISKRSIVKDCCYVEDGTVIAADVVIPPFSRVAGCPGQVVGDILPESVAVELVDDAVDAYTEFAGEIDDVE